MVWVSWGGHVGGQWVVGVGGLSCGRWVQLVSFECLVDSGCPVGSGYSMGSGCPVGRRCPVWSGYLVGVLWGVGVL